MAPLRSLKSCRKLKGADFFYVGSIGQEPNWFARKSRSAFQRLVESPLSLRLAKCGESSTCFPRNPKIA